MKVESPMPFPIIFGSTTFPTIIFTATKAPAVQITPPKPSCTAANKTAGTAAIMEPMFGI